MTEMMQRTCPICGGPARRASIHTPFAYWRCDRCATSHLAPQPSAEYLRQFYEAFHQPSEAGVGFADFEGRTAADFPAKAAWVAKVLRDGAQRDGGALRVLDVGCGKGFFVRVLQGVSLQAEGLDISEAAIREGTRSGVAGLRAGMLSEQRDWRGRFDAVTSWATIEHLPDPLAYLREMREALKPGGRLFLDTGLAGDFVERRAPGLTQWYDPPQHLFVFSRAGMGRLLRDAGFVLERFDANYERTAARRVLKFIRNRILAAAGGLLFRAGCGAAVYSRMRMEAKMPFGSLMSLVARKPR